jgi:hypothetical protein
MNLNFFALSHIGLKRKRKEDAYFVPGFPISEPNESNSVFLFAVSEYQTAFLWLRVALPFLWDPAQPHLCSCRDGTFFSNRGEQFIGAKAIQATCDRWIILRTP